MITVDDIKKGIGTIKSKIILIPDNTVIEPSLLGELTNDEFASVFRRYQNMLAEMYGEIEKDPERYGFSPYPTLHVYYRLCYFILYIFKCGKYSSGCVTVNKAEFKKNYKYNKQKMLNDFLAQYGFVIEDFSTNSEAFTVSWPTEPSLMYVLSRNSEALIKTDEWGGYLIGSILYASYRWVEAANTQTHEKRFLAHMDVSSERFRELQYWLYDKAKEYGYHIPDGMIGRGYAGVLYKKGSKEFLSIFENENAVHSHINHSFFCKMILRNVFKTHPDAVTKAAAHFPDTFTDRTQGCQEWCGNRDGRPPDEFNCGCHVNFEFDGVKRTNCSHRSFYFRNPKLEDMPILFELFLLENKIKPLNG